MNCFLQRIMNLYEIILVEYAYFHEINLIWTVSINKEEMGNVTRSGVTDALIFVACVIKGSQCHSHYTQMNTHCPMFVASTSLAAHSLSKRM